MFTFLYCLGYQQGTKRKADDDVYFSESSVPSSHSGHSDDDEPILVESSESEPEFDCEDWDTEYKVVDIKPVESSICGCKLYYFVCIVFCVKFFVLF